MYVKAKFKGKDGSDGYRTNATYLLWMWTRDERLHIENMNVGSAGNQTQYESLKAFLNNWEVWG